MKFMKAILAGVLIGICLPLVAGYLFVILGGMPMATKGGPLPIEQFLAKKGLEVAIGKEAGKPSPLSGDEPNLLEGARVYRQAQCWLCHGQLGQPVSAIAKECTRRRRSFFHRSRVSPTIQWE